MAQNSTDESGPRLRLVAAPWSSLYDLPVDAVVEEQDRYRMLGMDNTLPEPVSESYPRLVRDIESEKPVALGRLLRGGGRPMLLQAVILDIDRGRHVEIEHLREIADRICLLVDAAPIRRLGMPLLGGVHGDVAPAVFASIFAPRLRATRLETLYLLTGSNPGRDVTRQLEAAFVRRDRNH